MRKKTVKVVESEENSCRFSEVFRDAYLKPILKKPIK